MSFCVCVCVWNADRLKLPPWNQVFAVLFGKRSDDHMGAASFWKPAFMCANYSSPANFISQFSVLNCYSLCGCMWNTWKKNKDEVQHLEQCVCVLHSFENLKKYCGWRRWSRETQICCLRPYEGSIHTDTKCVRRLTFPMCKTSFDINVSV